MVTNNSGDDTSSGGADGCNPRLPIVMVPRQYDLTYTRIDLVNYSFEGSVGIDCAAIKSIPGGDRTAVKLHAIEIQFLRATLSLKKSANDGAGEVGSPPPAPAASPPLLQAVEFRCNFRDQTCEIVFDGTDFVNEGSEYVLSIDFRGILNDQMHGFYRSTYEGERTKRIIRDLKKTPVFPLLCLWA